MRPQGRVTLQIFATDLDASAIEAARQGVLPGNIAAEVSPDRHARHFTAESGSYRIHRNVRETVVCAPQDITVDPPFTRLDLLSCRNLLTRFSSRLERKLLPLFHCSLHPGGLLVLGSAETVGNFGHLFEPVSLKARIYRRNTQAPTLSDLESRARGGTTAAAASPPTAADDPEHIGQLTDPLIQQTWAPAGALVNAELQ